MDNGQHVLVVGGGLAGLSAGSYLLANGHPVTIVEHGEALGGVCTAWRRGDYALDGCIQWLTGGAFEPIYRELEILPRVPLQTLQHFVTYRDVSTGTNVDITADLDATARALIALAPEDADELRRMMTAADQLVHLRPPIDSPPELATLRDQLGWLWELRHDLPSLVHFRKTLGVWSREHLKNARLRRLFCRLFPESIPTLFVLLVIGYLKHGHLSRPLGGTASFRDALIDTYRNRGGKVRLRSTVEEILVKNGHAHGVRLANGEIIESDVVVSTASMPETVLQLLQGQYGAEETRERVQRWKLFEPLVIVSLGVALPLRDMPHTLLLDGIESLDTGGHSTDHVQVLTYNDDPSLAPVGHTVVQLMAEANYEWWSSRGEYYEIEKEQLAARALDRIEAHLPGLRAAQRVSDVATPLTFWTRTHTWRGAYEGWLPAKLGHIRKTLGGLSDFYMAGQWVEPGGGVPMALMSGRHVAQLICANARESFRATPAAA